MMPRCVNHVSEHPLTMSPVYTPTGTAQVPRPAPEGRPRRVELSPADRIWSIRHQFAHGIPKSWSYVLWGCVKAGPSIKLLKLSEKQAELYAEIDRLTRATMVEFIRREAELVENAPAGARVTTPDEVRAKCREIVRNAEQMVLKGVFTPQQVEGIRWLNWKWMDIEALRVPEVAKRLRLSVAQRQRIEELIAERDAGLEILSFETIGPDGIKRTVSSFSEEGGRIIRARTQFRDDANRMIWDVLSPRQLDTWRRLTILE